MARYEEHPLNDGAPGSAKACENLRYKWVQATGGYSGTVKVEGSIDGTNWVTVATAVANGDLVEIPQTLKRIRYDNSNVSAGDATIVLGAYNQRME